jgi:hypothetical protein
VGKVANHTTLPWVFVTGGVREAYTRRKDNKLIRGSEKITSKYHRGVMQKENKKRSAKAPF